MPTTFGSQIRTVADIVQTVTKCSKPQADAAEAEICASPEAKQKLAIACGLATAAVGYGGVLIVTSPASGGSSAVPGLILAGAGLIAARKFCKPFVKFSVPDQ